MFLDVSIAGDEHRPGCEDVRVIGNLVWAMPEDTDREMVVSPTNVTGVAGDVVEHEVEAIDSPGGRFTELVTDLS